MNLQNKLREIEAKVQFVKQVTEAIYKTSKVPYPSYFWGDFKGVTQDGAVCEDCDSDTGYIPLEWLEMSEEEITTAVAKKHEQELARLTELVAKREDQQRQLRLATYRNLRQEFGDID